MLLTSPRSSQTSLTRWPCFLVLLLWNYGLQFLLRYLMYASNHYAGSAFLAHSLAPSLSRALSLLHVNAHPWIATYELSILVVTETRVCDIAF